MKNPFDDFEDAPSPTVAKGTATVPDTLLDALRAVESGNNPRAVSPKGAQGPYQFMPATAKALGLTDPFDETASREAAKKLLTENLTRFGGNMDHALMAYNWGPADTAAWIKTGKGRKGQPMPAETQAYVKKIRDKEASIGKVPQVNPFDAFGDAPKKVTAPAMPHDEMVRKASEMALDGIGWDGRLLAGLGKTAADFGRTIGLGEDDKDSQIRDKALTNTGGGFAGNIVGDVAATIVPGAKVFKMVSAIPKLARAAKPAAVLGRNMIAGGAAGAVSEGMLNRDPREGAIVGGAMPVVGKTLLSLGSGMSNLYQQAKGGASGRLVNEVRNSLGNRALLAARELEKMKPLVHGEVLTAEKIASPQFPEFAVWGKKARNSKYANVFQQADKTSSLARERALRGIDTRGDRPIIDETGRVGKSSFERFRENVTKPIYNAAMPDKVPVSLEMEKVLLSPDVYESFNKGMKNFVTASRLLRSQGKAPLPSGRHVRDRRLGELSIAQMQHIREALDSKIGSMSFANPARDNLISARKQVASIMDEKSPRWAAANRAFREHSVPQNQADVISQLSKTMNRSTGDVQQQATDYANALRDPGKLLADSGLPEQFQTLEQVFLNNPGKLQTIKDIGESLSRDQRIRGMNTSAGIVPEYLSGAEKLDRSVPNLLRASITSARSLLRFMTRQSDEKVAELLHSSMADPKKMADIIKQLPTNERNAVMNRIREVAAKVPDVSTVPLTTMINNANSSN